MSADVGQWGDSDGPAQPSHTANAELTFKLDHLMGADQSSATRTNNTMPTDIRSVDVLSLFRTRAVKASSLHQQ